MGKKLNYPADCNHEWWEPDPDFEASKIFGEPVMVSEKRCRLCGSVVKYIPPMKDLLTLGWRRCKD